MVSEVRLSHLEDANTERSIGELERVVLETSMLLDCRRLEVP